MKIEVLDRGSYLTSPLTWLGEDAPAWNRTSKEKELIPFLDQIQKEKEELETHG